MINLPSELLKLQQGNDLRPLKPFVLLYRNKWDEQANKYVVEDTPIDVTLMVVKPNTLSMTLDVNEVAQYNANNITITLSDKNNRFVEGTPHSYFPEGYQLYGSRMVLYYGIDTSNRTALFTGVIKDLPTYKPELHQVDVKLVSPLELLKDIEAKEFSNKFYGEILHYDHTDDSGNPVYRTHGVGVGGFNAVYGNGIKLFDGVDYEVDQINVLGRPALLTIINPEYRQTTISCDYYAWKTGLTVEQIVDGLISIAGYDNNTKDIRNVVWNTAVRSRYDISALAGIGYYKDGNEYKYFYQSLDYGLVDRRGLVLNGDCKIEFNFQNTFFGYYIGDEILLGQAEYYPRNGISITADMMFGSTVVVSYFQDGVAVRRDELSSGSWSTLFNIKIEKNNTIFKVTISNGTNTNSASYDVPQQIRQEQIGRYREGYVQFYGYNIQAFQNGQLIGTIDQDRQVLFELINMNSETTLDAIEATFASSTQYSLSYRYGVSPNNLSAWEATSFGSASGIRSQYFQYLLQVHTNVNFSDVYATFLSSSLTLQFVNLSDKTILEALQDFALISGYEFGVNRNGVFFFRPRVQSTEPICVLDDTELVKVESIKKELTDFFTKLTLTFAKKPLEFYANNGNRPTLTDKYGIINKEIDKPEIINYDNPELAQAIGPQLLDIYSHLRNQLQVSSKLNLALELGDIVNLKRSYLGTVDKNASDLKKYERQQTYYRACKIVGINYNFAKKQMSYTLQDISDENNKPPLELNEFVYTLPIQLGVK